MSIQQEIAQINETLANRAAAKVSDLIHDLGVDREVERALELAIVNYAKRYAAANK
jgi:hypothetical protein